MLTEENQKVLSNAFPFWKFLSQSQQEGLLNQATEIHYGKGDVMHYGGVDCIGVVYVKSGSLRVYLLSEEGREINLYRLEKGQFCVLSASCVLETIDFDVSIEAEEECDILQIASSYFAKLSSENIHVELFGYKMATERFSEVMWSMQELLFKNIDQRLADFLIKESERKHSETVHMTQEEIAKYLGSAREVISRMLKHFAKDGYVTVSRGGIHIESMDGLRKVIDGKK